MLFRQTTFLRCVSNVIVVPGACGRGTRCRLRLSAAFQWLWDQGSDAGAEQKGSVCSAAPLQPLSLCEARPRWARKLTCYHVNAVALCALRLSQIHCVSGMPATLSSSTRSRLYVWAVYDTTRVGSCYRLTRSLRRRRFKQSITSTQRLNSTPSSCTVKVGFRRRKHNIRPPSEYLHYYQYMALYHDDEPRRLGAQFVAAHSAVYHRFSYTNSSLLSVQEPCLPCLELPHPARKRQSTLDPHHEGYNSV